MLSELLKLHPLYIRNNIINNSYTTNNNKYDSINSSIHDDDSNNNEYTMITKKYNNNNNKVASYIKSNIRLFKRFLAKIKAKISRIWLRLLSHVRI